MTKVKFSNDGAQVFSSDHESTRIWDVASGLQVCKLAGSDFAVVEGADDTQERVRHVVTARSDMLLIYNVSMEQQHAEDGEAATVVACFKAPAEIVSLRCHGAAICVGCKGGAVCALSTPFLAV